MLSELRTGFQSSMVNGLENLDIELLGFGRIKGHAKCHEGIGETSTKTDGAMAEVRTMSFKDWVIVDVDDAVQVVGDDLDDLADVGQCCAWHERVPFFTPATRTLVTTMTDRRDILEYSHRHPGGFKMLRYGNYLG